MAHVALTLATAGLLLTSTAYAATQVKHSGMIVATSPNGRTITVEEMGPWTGPGSGLVRRSVRLTPQTKVVLVSRSNEPTPGGWPGGFREVLSSPSELRPGDYVTVATESRGGELIPRSIAVSRLSAAQSRPRASGRRQLSVLPSSAVLNRASLRVRIQPGRPRAAFRQTFMPSWTCGKRRHDVPTAR